MTADEAGQIIERSCDDLSALAGAIPSLFVPLDAAVADLFALRTFVLAVGENAARFTMRYRVRRLVSNVVHAVESAPPACNSLLMWRLAIVLYRLLDFADAVTLFSPALRDVTEVVS